jgi:hypothetical protein
MTDSLSRKPRFKVGDRVSVVSHGDVRGRVGSIAEVVSAPIDAVYRYRVRFDDGTAAIFFGFELERIIDSEAASY